MHQQKSKAQALAACVSNSLFYADKSRPRTLKSKIHYKQTIDLEKFRDCSGQDLMKKCNQHNKTHNFELVHQIAL
jgi:hypothetical protein